MFLSVKGWQEDAHASKHTHSYSTGEDLDFRSRQVSGALPWQTVAHIPSALTGSTVCTGICGKEHGSRQQLLQLGFMCFPSSAPRPQPLGLSVAGASTHYSMKASTCVCVTNTQSQQKGCRTPQHMPCTHDCTRVGQERAACPCHA